MMDDAVDRILAQWKSERPDLDPSPMGIVGRISRLALILNREIQINLENLDITPGEFDVLAALRRSGAPYQLNPTALYQSLMLSSGAMTNRLDRLEEAGYILRLADRQDRRGTLVRLTNKGLKFIDKAVEKHLLKESKLIASLTVEEQEHLIPILRNWLQRIETSTQHAANSE